MEEYKGKCLGFFLLLCFTSSFASRLLMDLPLNNYLRSMGLNDEDTTKLDTDHIIRSRLAELIPDHMATPHHKLMPQLSRNSGFGIGEGFGSGEGTGVGIGEGFGSGEGTGIGIGEGFGSGEGAGIGIGEGIGSESGQECEPIGVGPLPTIPGFTVPGIIVPGISSPGFTIPGSGCTSPSGACETAPIYYYPPTEGCRGNCSPYVKSHDSKEGTAEAPISMPET